MHDKTVGTALPSVMALAFLGDARHSLFIRDMLVRRGLSRSSDLNRESLRYVTAEAQAAAFLRVEPLLLDDERDVFRRAFNSGHLNCPKHAAITEYRTATGFEAVIGMLAYLGDEERAQLLLSRSVREDRSRASENADTAERNDEI